MSKERTCFISLVTKNGEDAFSLLLGNFYPFPLACCPFPLVTQNICMVHFSLEHKCSFTLDVLSVAREPLCIHRYRPSLCSKGNSLHRACRAEDPFLALCTSTINEAYLKDLKESLLSQKCHQANPLLSLPKVLPHVLLPRPGPDTAVSRFHSARGERGAGSTAQLCRTAGGGRKHLPPELHCITGQGCVHEGSESKLRALIAASNYSHSTNLTALRTKSVMTFCKIMIIQSVSENVPHHLDMF